MGNIEEGQVAEESLGFGFRRVNFEVLKFNSGGTS